MAFHAALDLIHPIQFEGQAIMMFRDDLYPAVGGGNKARKMQFISQDIAAKGANAVVTTGGIQSNHCRAVAISAAQHGWKCRLVLHGANERYLTETGNTKLMRLAGAEIVFAEPDEIAGTMDEAMEDFGRRGYQPYYINGGGHTIKGGEAYVQAVSELKGFCERENWYPDYIFLATGTGSTHAGIMAGLDQHQLNAEVVGISIARAKARAEEVVEEFYNSLRSELQIITPKRKVTVQSDYLAGGYEGSNQQIKQVIADLAKHTGIFTDPTYTGKAFWGMLELLRAEQVSGKVLFWHTGGINNLIASNII